MSFDPRIRSQTWDREILLPVTEPGKIRLQTLRRRYISSCSLLCSFYPGEARFTPAVGFNSFLIR